MVSAHCDFRRFDGDGDNRLPVIPQFGVELVTAHLKELDGRSLLDQDQGRAVQILNAAFGPGESPDGQSHILSDFLPLKQLLASSLERAQSATPHLWDRILLGARGVLSPVEDQPHILMLSLHAATRLLSMRQGELGLALLKPAEPLISAKCSACTQLAATFLSGYGHTLTGALDQARADFDSLVLPLGGILHEQLGGLLQIRQVYANLEVFYRETNNLRSLAAVQRSFEHWSSGYALATAT
jgi:hypothetical protein